MLRKFCRCGRIIPIEKKMCDKCEAKYISRIKVTNKDIYKRYKNNRTDFKEQKFYNSKEWKFTRPVIILRDKGICQLCNSNKEFAYIDTVHHIIELKEDYSLRTANSNLIGLCDKCHKYVHKKYKKNAISKKEMQKKLSDIVKNLG